MLCPRRKSIIARVIDDGSPTGNAHSVCGFFHFPFQSIDSGQNVVHCAWPFWRRPFHVARLQRLGRPGNWLAQISQSQRIPPDAKQKDLWTKFPIELIINDKSWPNVMNENPVTRLIIASA
jgi:hypothetical protein